MAGPQTLAVTVEGKTLEFTNLGKVFYPEVGFTKGEVIDYYARIAPVLLPHLHDRPLTLKRYPDGVDGPFFYQKQSPSHRPKWMETVRVWSDVRNDDILFSLANDLPSLLWLVNTADLEMHALLSKKKDATRPTAVAFDLDPGLPADLTTCLEVALELRDRLRSLGLSAYPKTSGGKGMQVYVPLNTPTTYDDTKPFAHAIAQALERWRPSLVTSRMSKSLRSGKVFVDWSQNDEHKTTVCVYSLRARPRPTVSTPLSWGEVEEAHAARHSGGLVFSPAQVVARSTTRGDLFESVLTERQKLPRGVARERVQG